MPRVDCYIEDAEAGANVRWVFPGGFKPESPAHQLANIIRKLLDKMADNGELTRLGEATEEGDMTAANEALAEVPESPLVINSR